MTGQDPLTLLREAHPADRLGVDLDAPPPADMLERITATPRRPRRRARRRLVVAAVAAGAAAAAAAAVAPSGSTFDPAARAYAQTAPGRHILHVDLTLTTTTTGPIAIEQRTDEEIWQYGDRTHRVEQSTQHDDSAGTPEHETFDHVKVGDVERTRMDSGEIQILRATDSGEARQALTTDTDFIASFRRRYASHTLRDAGETTFAGRRARAYVVTDPEAQTPGGLPSIAFDSETYYIDAKTGDPLGSIQSLALRELKRGPDGKPAVGPDGKPIFGAKIGEQRATEVVNRLERLPLTPENLARLSAPWADGA